MNPHGGWKILHRAEIDSTQSEARRLLASPPGRGGDLHRVAVTADVQTAGLGRRGRSFESPLGGAWQTLIVADGAGERPSGREPLVAAKPNPPKPAARGPLDGRLAPAVALAIADALEERGREVGLKWPNDLYRDGRKCGGILVERVRGHLLVGVGLNAENVPPPGFARLDLPAEPVRMLVREALDRVLTGSYDDPSVGWARFDLLHGRTVTVGDRRGVAEGIAPDGALRLRGARGERFDVRSGGVDDVRPPIGAPPAPRQSS